MSTAATKPRRSSHIGGFLGNAKGGDTRSPGVRARSRSRSLIILAALLVLGFGLATAFMVTRAGDKVSVLAVGSGVTKGHIIERSDLISQSVSGVPNAILVDQVDSVVGRTTTVDLVDGQILSSGMVTTTPTPNEGESMVGLSLDPTRVPSSGLTAGDIVDVIAVPGGDQGGKANQTDLDAPTVLASRATVYAIEGLATDGGQMLLTVVVADSDANKVAAYSTNSRVAVVEVTSSGGN